MSMYSQNEINRLEYGRAETGESIRRTFFNQVYLWMAVGLVVTAAISAAVAFTPAAQGFFRSPPGAIAAIIMFVGLIGIGWTFNRVVFRMSLTAATLLYMTYCAFMGVLMSYIWLAYRIETIGAAFILTGGIFALMSVIGYTTKVDLSRVGAILMMAVLGIFLASIVNIFVASSMLDWVLTYLCVAVFTGLIAYFTQHLKQMADEHGHDAAIAPKIALIGSFELYWAFINLFLNILRILGDRR